jgi:hypothetical protein
VCYDCGKQGHWTSEGDFQLMQLICSTFKVNCSTFNWVVWFSTKPYLASLFTYLIKYCFLYFIGLSAILKNCLFD